MDKKRKVKNKKIINVLSFFIFLGLISLMHFKESKFNFSFNKLGKKNIKIFDLKEAQMKEDKFIISLNQEDIKEEQSIISSEDAGEIIDFEIL